MTEKPESISSEENDSQTLTPNQRIEKARENEKINDSVRNVTEQLMFNIPNLEVLTRYAERFPNSSRSQEIQEKMIEDVPPPAKWVHSMLQGIIQEVSPNTMDEILKDKETQ